MKKEAGKAAKIEKKLTVYNGGYMVCPLLSLTLLLCPSFSPSFLSFSLSLLSSLSSSISSPLSFLSPPLSLFLSTLPPSLPLSHSLLLTLSPPQSRSDSSLKQIAEIYNQLEQSSTEANCFKALRNIELEAVASRIAVCVREGEGGRGRERGERERGEEIDREERRGPTGTVFNRSQLLQGSQLEAVASRISVCERRKRGEGEGEGREGG
jgi:hypothetical protein